MVLHPVLFWYVICLETGYSIPSRSLSCFFFSTIFKMAIRWTKICMLRPNSGSCWGWSSILGILGRSPSIQDLDHGTCGGSLNWGYHKMVGFCEGTSHLEMDDLGVPLWLRKPPWLLFRLPSGSHRLSRLELVCASGGRPVTQGWPRDVGYGWIPKKPWGARELRNVPNHMIATVH